MGIARGWRGAPASSTRSTKTATRSAASTSPRLAPVRGTAMPRVLCADTRILLTIVSDRSKLSTPTRRRLPAPRSKPRTPRRRKSTISNRKTKGWGRRRRRLNRILVKKHFRCHYNQNWVNGMRYSQKVIKASSRAAAAQMCVNDCARMAGCTGFFYQKHKNGHQICGFYKSKIGAGSWHGHAEGAVCRYSHTTHHRGQEQALDTDEEEVASSEIEAENAASPEVNDIESEVEAKTKGWGRRRRRLNRILVKKHFRCHYNQNW